MCIVYEAQVNLQVKRIEVTVEASDDAVMPQSDVVNAFTKKKVGVTVRGKILEWEKIGEFGELWSLRQYFTRQ